jgi:hypothetical protein
MKKDIEFQKLIINPENYRFDPVENQQEAIDLMLEEKGDEIFNLASHILKYGLDKAKDSRVLEIKKNLYLILDGNRRATAIKCLHDPGLVKKQILRNKFLNLLKENNNPPSFINSFIYKNETDAAEWIKLDHTGKNNGVGQDPWEPAGKDRFDYKFSGKISPGMQVVDLFRQETKRPIDTKKLKLSTINRILSNPESRSFLGIDIRNGTVLIISSKKEVVERLDILFNKIIVDDISVNAVYHVPDSIRFMKDLFVDKPKILAKSSVAIITPTGDTKKLRSVPKSTERSTLIPRDCVLCINEKRINNIYHELKDLALDNATNAIGVLFRVFLETSLDCYADTHGLTFSKNTKLDGKIFSVASYLEKNKSADKKQLKNIRSVTNKGTSILSIDSFHEYVHSFKTQPVPIDLIYKWDNLQEFFEILWGEISKKHQIKKKKI